jgi:hypothetical protein
VLSPIPSINSLWPGIATVNPENRAIKSAPEK